MILLERSWRVMMILLEKIEFRNNYSYHSGVVYIPSSIPSLIMPIVPGLFRPTRYTRMYVILVVCQ